MKDPIIDISAKKVQEWPISTWEATRGKQPPIGSHQGSTNGNHDDVSLRASRMTRVSGRKRASVSKAVGKFGASRHAGGDAKWRATENSMAALRKLDRELTRDRAVAPLVTDPKG